MFSIFPNFEGFLIQPVKVDICNRISKEIRAWRENQQQSRFKTKKYYQQDSNSLKRYHTSSNGRQSGIFGDICPKRAIHAGRGDTLSDPRSVPLAAKNEDKIP